MYDPHIKVACLKSTWISKASARQRKGRAGRTRSGICYHMYSSARHESMAEFQDSELLRMPLEEVVLQVGGGWCWGGEGGGVGLVGGWCWDGLSALFSRPLAPFPFVFMLLVSSSLSLSLSFPFPSCLSLTLILPRPSFPSFLPSPPSNPFPPSPHSCPGKATGVGAGGGGRVGGGLKFPAARSGPPARPVHTQRRSVLFVGGIHGLCVCVSERLCLCVRVCMCLCLGMCLCIYVSVCVSVFLSACVCLSVSVFLCGCIFVSVFVCLCICVCLCRALCVVVGWLLTLEMHTMFSTQC